MTSGRRMMSSPRSLSGSRTCSGERKTKPSHLCCGATSVCHRQKYSTRTIKQSISQNLSITFFGNITWTHHDLRTLPPIKEKEFVLFALADPLEAAMPCKEQQQPRADDLEHDRQLPLQKLVVLNRINDNIGVPSKWVRSARGKLPERKHYIALFAVLARM